MVPFLKNGHTLNGFVAKMHAPLMVFVKKKYLLQIPFCPPPLHSKLWIVLIISKIILDITLIINTLNDI